MMKGLFVRLDPELDRAFTDLCKREGYTKGGLIAKLLRQFLAGHGAPLSDPIAAAKEFGIDTTLLYSNLDKSPTERLVANQNALEFTEKLRTATKASK